jgi:hypothetical protein
VTLRTGSPQNGRAFPAPSCSYVCTVFAVPIY